GRFAEQRCVNAFDFFCIVIWKANRAKSRIARRLLAKGHSDLNVAVAALCDDVAAQPAPRERLRCLLVGWGFRLPMATAILTVFYPEVFTVYDTRVCDALGACHGLGNQVSFERIWDGYQDYLRRVIEATPEGLCLRDRDRWLWGRSFDERLRRDIGRAFRDAPDQGNGGGCS
ncbi:MAG: hypothetical protein ACUVX9_19260, partial [Anaerolineae bacterium]